MLALNPLIAEQLNYEPAALLADLDVCLQQMNPDQRSAYDQIIASVETSQGQLFFLNGPGGTGKTFVYNTVCAKLRSTWKVVLCVSSGILALLINGGCTAHSMFKIPIDSLRDHSVCGMQRNSHWGEFMRAAHVIIWEVSAQHRHAVEAVEHTLRDVRNIDRPFGGLTVFRWFNCLSVV